jgi:hypothetical protein
MGHHYVNVLDEVKVEVEGACLWAPGPVRLKFK